jgi:hypothetical protein
MCRGLTGASHDGDGLIFDRNNRFEHNTYYVDNLVARFWTWRDATLTKELWQGYGQDVTGSFFQQPC